MDPILLLIGLTVAGSIGLLIFMAYQQLGARRRAVADRLAPGGNIESELSLGSALRQHRRGFFLFNLLPLSSQAEQRMGRDLERAGWPIRVGEYLSLRLAGAAVGGVAGWLILFVLDLGPGWLGWLRVVLLFVLALVGWLFPRLLLNRARGKRLERIELQLMDALMGMVRSLRSGTGFLQTLSYAAAETPAPLGPELQRTVRELQLGAEAEGVFGALNERVGSADLDIVLTAIVIQRTSGGNLSEILSNVANTMRERAKIKGEVRVLTAEQRLMGNLMALVPVLIAAALILINRDMGKLLFGTTVGQISLAIAILLELVGLWVIRRLAVIQV
jgi:tight adherence protein B